LGMPPSCRCSSGSRSPVRSSRPWPCCVAVATLAYLPAIALGVLIQPPPARTIEPCGRLLISRRANREPSGRGKPRRGSVLAEFAMIALVLYLILRRDSGVRPGPVRGAGPPAGGGHCGAGNQPHFPCPPRKGPSTMSSIAATAAYRAVRQSIFDESLPQRSRRRPSSQQRSGRMLPLVTYFADKPIVNQLLFPLMVVEGEGDQQVLQYPGLVPNPNPTPNGPQFSDRARPILLARVGAVRRLRGFDRFSSR